MAKDPKIGVFWKFLFGTVTCLSLVLPVLSDRTSCSDSYGLNYTLPMFQKCKMMRLHDGSMVQSIPKLIPFPSVIGGCHQRRSREGIPGGHRICRIPYCDGDICNNGWCEETMVGYNCTCSSGFQGRHCDEIIVESTTELTIKPTTSPSTTMTERSDTTTSQGTTTSDSVTTETKTESEPSPTATMPERSEATTSQETTTSKSAELSTTGATGEPTTSPTTTISDTTTSQDTITSKLVTTEAKTESEPSPTATMSERSEVTTSQETTTSKSGESSTLDATTKPMTSPTTTISDTSYTTTIQETTNSTCSSPPMEYKYGGSFYNFSTCRMNHSSAVSACSQYGSHLVFIESQEEQDFIRRSVQDYWIGLTGSSRSEARWLDGSNLTYSYFNHQFYHEGNCRIWFMHQHWNIWNIGWNAHDCSGRYRFICEKEVGI